MPNLAFGQDFFYYCYMKQHPATIKDIARELGISVSTVSRALKDHPDISSETKSRVKELVTRLRYTPNPIALSLRNKKTHVLAVIVPEIVHHFFSSVISGIDEAAMAAGFNVMFFQSNESYEREILNMQSVVNSRVDGLLISIAKGTRKYNHIRHLMDEGIPVVFFDRSCDEIDTDKVIVDDFDGAFQAVDYLIRTGCTRIAHYAGPQHLSISYQRKRGYISALEKHKLTVEEHLIVPCDNYSGALNATEQIMRLPQPPDAFFTSNDETAVGAINALKRMEFRIPEQVSVVGFTDGLVSTITDPLLTTVGQHGFEMGKKAAEILIRRIQQNGDNCNPLTEIIKTELIIRQSTRLPQN